ncbi:hypothetical protein THRCLA_05930 [Thraustotheca clavata]|uniref:Uncharacterized protein n=1 Tax=Thraustotheca clavata TaxID=74557 RepID=A0A1V9ZRA4_9STRA|nr:hypothetical protein THRCLA_05930 [Thraustotheca clavata]
MLGVWSIEDNEARAHFDAAELAEATGSLVPTKSFRKDYIAYCRLMQLIPHPKLCPNFDEEDKDCLHQNYDDSDVDTICVRNWVLDMPSLLLMNLALQRTSAVHTLTLFNASLSIAQLEFVCTNIPTTTIKILNLEWNDSKPADPPLEDHTVCFAKLLQETSQLTQLSLRANGITPQGMITLAEALKTNKTLLELNLFRNQIGDIGAEALAHAIAENRTLEHLSVANNNITGTGALALIRSITRFILTENQLKNMSDLEVLLLAALETAKKQKKKLDRSEAAKELNMIESETIDGVVYGIGNSTIQSMTISGNDLTSIEQDILPINELLERFEGKLKTHLAAIKVQRMFSPGQVKPPLSSFLVF